MRLLDLFCGAGGAAMGYERAGFDEIVGVDIKPQPVYKLRWKFNQMDALEWLALFLKHPEQHLRFDAIHASPPCQGHSTMRHMWNAGAHGSLIEPTRELLKATGLPYIIENVVGAPLTNPVKLCGSSFALGVRRHRLFETNFPVLSTGCRHDLQRNPIDVTGTGGPATKTRESGGGINRKPRNLDEARRAMGIDWMDRRALSQAIPPAYTEYIGSQLLDQLNRASA